MAVHLTRSKLKGFKSSVYPLQRMELMMTCSGMAVKMTGMLGASVRKMKALTAKMETVTLNDKGR
jgi:hypothetical protein